MSLIWCRIWVKTGDGLVSNLSPFWCRKWVPCLQGVALRWKMYHGAPSDLDFLEGWQPPQCPRPNFQTKQGSFVFQVGLSFSFCMFFFIETSMVCTRLQKVSSDNSWVFKINKKQPALPKTRWLQDPSEWILWKRWKRWKRWRDATPPMIPPQSLISLILNGVLGLGSGKSKASIPDSQIDFISTGLHHDCHVVVSNIF